MLLTVCSDGRKQPVRFPNLRAGFPEESGWPFPNPAYPLDRSQPETHTYTYIHDLDGKHTHRGGHTSVPHAPQTAARLQTESPMRPTASGRHSSPDLEHDSDALRGSQITGCDHISIPRVS